MRKYIKIAILGAVILTGSSCKKFLDVNENPNNPTNSTPNIVLPTAILAAANTIPNYDNFGAWTAGYKANAGGYGGFGSQWTYEYTTSDYSAMWTSAFTAINQLNFVINNTDATGPLKYYNGMARIIKSYVYQRLVDQYGDVPYSDAWKGLAKLNPAYDKYSDVYKAIYADLDGAIAVLNSAPVKDLTVDVSLGQDPLYGGSSTAGRTNWVKFANTIKLKILIRAKKATDLSTWVSTAKATLPVGSDKYLTDDAIVNPGFNAATATQFNTKWAAFSYNINGLSVGGGSSQMPTPWILSFYNGGKLNDDERGKAIYVQYKATVSQRIGLITITFEGPATNQLGYDIEPVKRAAGGSIWYSGLSFPAATRPTGVNATRATNTVGVLKSAQMGMPILTAAESYFLQAEAALPGVNLVAGTPSALFENGITSSYRYLYKNAAGTYINPTAPEALKDKYKADNPLSPLVNFGLNGADEEKQLEAIITQKYIALNFIHSEEGYNEYRRTGYPISVTGSSDPLKSFTSLKASDGLPDRVLYPAIEFQVNSTNVPKGVTTKTKLFYAKK